MNGGPPAYHSTSGDSSHSGNEHKSTSAASTSFMVAFVQFVSQVAPDIMDWPADLVQVEPALRGKLPAVFAISRCVVVRYGSR